MFFAVMARCSSLWWLDVLYCDGYMFFTVTARCSSLWWVDVLHYDG